MECKQTSYWSGIAIVQGHDRAGTNHDRGVQAAARRSLDARKESDPKKRASKILILFHNITWQDPTAERKTSLGSIEKGRRCALSVYVAPSDNRCIYLNKIPHSDARILCLIKIQFIMPQCCK